jgi:hypothetical protein
MVAIACHDIGAHLYTIADGGLHPILPNPPSPTPPTPSTPPALPSLIKPRPKDPTIFTHPGYNNWENYPQGVADCAGYWAESQIFGGVVAFNRGELEKEVRFLSCSFFGLQMF